MQLVLYSFPITDINLDSMLRIGKIKTGSKSSVSTRISTPLVPLRLTQGEIASERQLITTPSVFTAPKSVSICKVKSEILAFAIQSFVTKKDLLVVRCSWPSIL